MRAIHNKTYIEILFLSLKMLLNKSFLFLLSIFNYIWVSLFVLVLALLTLLYYEYNYYMFRKWKKHNVPIVRSIPLFGNYLKVALGIENLSDMYKSIYYQLAGRKYGGFHQMRTPYLMVRDPEMINNILIKDFSYFTDRGVFTDFSEDPITDNLFWNENPQWKTMRQKLSPAFTSGKLKQMYGTINACSEDMMKNIHFEHKMSKDIEVRKIVSKFAINVIGICFFGLDIWPYDKGNSELHTYGITLFQPSTRYQLREVFVMTWPKLLKVFKFTNFPVVASEFFVSVFQDTIAYRAKNDIKRNDFIDCLIKARNDLVLNTNLPKKDRFTDIQIVANAFIMFAAGLETISSAISNCLQELALKKPIQDKLREEIIYKKSINNGIVDSDFLTNLVYLDMVVCETLRRYPATFALFRKATHTYNVPNDTLVIEKNQKLIIPIRSLHNDPRYFKDPEVFDPERFSPENKTKIPHGVYLPFGDGPRICIAKRFAELEIKLALVNILSEFNVEPCEKTKVPITFNCMSILPVPKDGEVWLKFNAISN